MATAWSDYAAFSSDTAFGKKLFLSLVVLASKALYRLPEGRRENSGCAGCVGSEAMFLALPLTLTMWVRTISSSLRWCIPGI